MMETMSRALLVPQPMQYTPNRAALLDIRDDERAFAHYFLCFFLRCATKSRPVMTVELRDNFLDFVSFTKRQKWGKIRQKFVNFWMTHGALDPQTGSDHRSDLLEALTNRLVAIYAFVRDGFDLYEKMRAKEKLFVGLVNEINGRDMVEDRAVHIFDNFFTSDEYQDLAIAAGYLRSHRFAPTSVALTFADFRAVYILWYLHCLEKELEEMEKRFADIPTLEACTNCLKDRQRLGIPGLKMCSGCKLTKYCTTECQKAHWRQHQALCEAVRTPKWGNKQKEAMLSELELQISHTVASHNQRSNDVCSALASDTIDPDEREPSPKKRKKNSAKASHIDKHS